METVKGTINAAEDRFFGKSHTQEHQEPISGVAGSGTSTDPYDAGNATEQPGNPVEGHNEGSAARLAADPNGTTANGTESSAPATEEPSSAQATKPQTNAPSSSTTEPISPRNTEKSQTSPGTSDENHPLEITPSSREGVIDPASVPQECEELVHDEAEEPPDSSSGDPKSLSSQSSSHKSLESAPAPQERNYKSTGFAAEGGNFDAKASGAGKEAGRLRGEHGEAVLTQSNEESHDPHHGGIWKGGHKSGLSISKAKDKLHIGKS